MDANVVLVEQFNDTARKASEMLKRFDDCLADANRSFIERYVSGKLHIGLCRASGDEAQWGFLIYRRDAVDGFESPPTLAVNPERLCTNTDREQAAMLTHDVELMEGPQRCIPSLVRFQRFDNATFAGGKPLYKFSTLIATRTKRSPAFGDRKIHIFGSRYAEAVSERCGENIKTTADGVDVRTDFDNERQREQLFLDRYYHQVLGCRVYINHVGVDVCFDPDMEPLLEGWELGYGPVNASLGV